MIHELVGPAGVRGVDYGLNNRGELEWVEIQVAATETGLLFTSRLDGVTYEVEGLTIGGLVAELGNLGGSDFTDDLLTMVGEMGGGIWPNDPDGTSTSYEFDSGSGLLTVIER